MRKIIIVAFLILTAAITGILQIKTSPQDMDMTARHIKIGVLLGGSRSDRSYCQSHCESLEALRDEFDLEIFYREDVADECYPDIVSLVRDEGCQIIIGTSFHHGQSMEQAARMYPDVYFLHASGLGHRSNFASFFGRMYQARYLSGIIAGMKTKTGHLGYVAAFPIPEVIRGLNAFTLGVRSVRPDAVVHVRYAKSWSDDEPTGAACARLLDRYPIDVVGMHTNSLAPHREAERRGIWSVGCNLDNALSYPNTYLSACVWNWDAYYRRQIRECLQGKFKGSHVWLSMRDGIVAVSPPTSHVDAGAMAAVQAVEGKIRDRTFDVFYGPINDNEGHIRVPEGESMSDDEMLNGFYWYVEGVTVEGI